MCSKHLFKLLCILMLACCNPIEGHWICKDPQKWNCWNFLANVTRFCLDYNSRLSPMQALNQSKPTIIEIDIDIRKIRELDTKNKEVIVEKITGISWIDPRLALDKNVGNFLSNNRYCYWYDNRALEYMDKYLWHPKATVDGIVKKKTLEDVSAFYKDSLELMWSGYVKVALF